jgi:putative restriction endonuclease
MDMSFLTIGAKYTRPELAVRWKYESHHAISRGVVTPQGGKVIILFVTRLKQEALTQYRDYLSGDLLFWEGQEKHGTDDRIIDAEKAGDEIHLFYREVHHCPFEYKGRAILLNAIRKTDVPSQFVFRLEHDQGVADDLERFRRQIDAIPGITEREEVRKARVGQGRFRKMLLELWGSRCAVTQVEMPSLLMAAHIKPWRCATNAERLDVHNGLLILPQYDKLFDRGFISFTDDGGILVSPALPKDKFDLLGVREDAKLAVVSPPHRPFLSFHRDRVFIRNEAQD